jgi:hypothetical protein
MRERRKDMIRNSPGLRSDVIPENRVELLPASFLFSVFGEG